MRKTLKTFSEVKLRKIDDDVTYELNEIMDHYKQLSASGGLTHYILDLSKTKSRIVELEQENEELKRAIRTLKSTILEKEGKVQAIQSTFATLINLLKPD